MKLLILRGAQFVGRHLAETALAWIPRTETGLSTVNCAKAIRAGLAFQPLVETIRDIWRWDQTLAPEAPRHAGLPPEREAALLRQWHARNGG
jgi:hypothetical protein